MKQVISIIRTGMVYTYMSQRQQTHRDENVSQLQPIGLQSTMKKPRTTWQAAADPKTSLYIGTAKELPLYTQLT